MLEWKPRLVTLLIVGASVAAALGSFIGLHNYGW
jgi:hypothetical protein